jgi:NitT/TauT family transport system substrate-binding protein
MVQAGHADLWVAGREIIPDFPVAILLFGPTLLEENPDAGRRFMVAFVRSLRQWSQGKTERNVELAQRFTGLDRELLMIMCWSPVRESGEVNVQSMLDYQAWAVERGYLESPVTEKQLWDPSFIEHANGVLGANTD